MQGSGEIQGGTGVGQLEHQPGLGNILHESTGGGNDLPDIIQAIIAHMQGRKVLPAEMAQKFGKMFPDTFLSGQQHSKQEKQTERQGQLPGTSQGGIQRLARLRENYPDPFPGQRERRPGQ